MRRTLIVAALLAAGCQYDVPLGDDVADAPNAPPVDEALLIDSGSADRPSGDGFACLGFYDTNYNHVVAGRAYRCGVGGSYVCAVGSKIQFGLWTEVPSWLRETAPGYYEPGPCP
jgi:hypothetical protein